MGLRAKIVGSNPTGAWMFFCCECCVLSRRGLCDELITRPEESYRMCCVVVCDLESLRMRRPWPALGRSATEGGGSGGLRRTSCYCDLGKLFPFVVRILYPFLVRTLLPTYCRCRILLLHLIPVNDTQTHTHTPHTHTHTHTYTHTR